MIEEYMTDPMELRAELRALLREHKYSDAKDLFIDKVTRTMYEVDTELQDMYEAIKKGLTNGFN